MPGMTQQRQRHLESRASEVGLKHFEMTLVEFNESLRDGETEPSVRRLPLEPPSTWRNLSKIASRYSGLTPGPTHVGVHRPDPQSDAPPEGTKLHAFDSRFITTRCTLATSMAATVTPAHRAAASRFVRSPRCRMRRDEPHERRDVAIH